MESSVLVVAPWQLCPGALLASGGGRGPRQMASEQPSRGREAPRTEVLEWSALASPSQQLWAGQSKPFHLQSAHSNCSPRDSGALSIRCRGQGAGVSAGKPPHLGGSPGALGVLALESRCPCYPRSALPSHPPWVLQGTLEVKRLCPRLGGWRLGVVVEWWPLKRCPAGTCGCVLFGNRVFADVTKARILDKLIWDQGGSQSPGKVSL